MDKKLYQAFAGAVLARENSIKRGEAGASWVSHWSQYLEILARHHLPSGSGFDAGTKIDLGASTGERLVFTTAFHHMDEMGGYDGWTEHKIIVTPSLVFGIGVRVTGKDRNQIKEYIAETFQYSLTRGGEETTAAAHGRREKGA